MSGSFYTLNQKYNTLLSLELSSAGGVPTVPDLQTVTDNGNTTTNSITVSSVSSDTSISPSQIQQNNTISGIVTNINDGFDLTKTTLVNEENVILNENSLTFIETSFSTIPPSIVSTNSLTQGQLRLEALVGNLEITPSNITINGTQGANYNILGIDNNILTWIPFQYDSGQVIFDPFTSYSITFTNPYFNVLPPKVFLSFENSISAEFINLCVTTIDQLGIGLEWTGFSFITSAYLVGTKMNWYSLPTV